MKQALLVTLSDGGTRIINEFQICSIEPQSSYVVLHLSNGESLQVSDPTWDEWLNDVLNRTT